MTKLNLISDHSIANPSSHQPQHPQRKRSQITELLASKPANPRTQKEEHRVLVVNHAVRVRFFCTASLYCPHRSYCRSAPCV